MCPDSGSSTNRAPRIASATCRDRSAGTTWSRPPAITRVGTPISSRRWVTNDEGSRVARSSAMKRSGVEGRGCSRAAAVNESDRSPRGRGTHLEGEPGEEATPVMDFGEDDPAAQALRHGGAGRASPRRPTRARGGRRARDGPPPATGRCARHRTPPPRRPGGEACSRVRATASAMTRGCSSRGASRGSSGSGRPMTVTPRRRCSALPASQQDVLGALQRAQPQLDAAQDEERRPRSPPGSSSSSRRPPSTGTDRTWGVARCSDIGR